MADLFNQQISATYSGLLKTTSNGVLSATLAQITDGRGNGSQLYLSTSKINFYNAYEFPTSDGSANQVLKTDGSGVLTWEDDANTGGVTKTGTIALNTIAVWNDNVDELRSDTTMSINTNHTISLLQPNSVPTDVSSYNIGGGNIANVTGQNNAGFGQANMQRVTTGSNNVAFGNTTLDKLTTGSNNTTIGNLGLFSLTEGDGNTSVGESSLDDVTTGSNNTAIGKDSGSAITTGSNNVIIGSNTGNTIATTSNNIIISDGSGNNRIQVDSGGDATFGGSVAISEIATITQTNAGTENRGLRLTNTDGSRNWNITAGRFNQNNDDFTIRNIENSLDALFISATGATTFSTGADRTLIIGKDSVDTGYNVVSLNGTTTKGSYSGLAGGGTSDNNLYLNSANDVLVQTGSGFSPKLTISSTGAATFSNSVTSGGTITNQISSGDAIVYAKNGTVTTMMIANSTAENIGIAGTESAHDYVIRTANTEKMRISSGGLATFSNGIQFAASTGIPSPPYDSGATTLDAYEEGTFTVSLISNGGGANLTPSNTTGYYTRVGNKVTIQYYSGSITVTNIGSGSGVVSGLPYASSSGVYHTLTLTHVNCYAALAQNGFINPGTSQFYAVQSNTTSTMAWKNSNGNYFMLGGTYLI